MQAAASRMLASAHQVTCTANCLSPFPLQVVDGVGCNDSSMLRRARQRAEEAQATTNIVMLERDNDSDTMESLKASPFLVKWVQGHLSTDAPSKPVLCVMMYM